MWTLPGYLSDLRVVPLQGLSVYVVLYPLYTAQNYLHLTPIFVYGKTVSYSAPSGYSKTSATCSVYGSPHERQRN